jgi:hypothetical protein
MWQFSPIFVVANRITEVIRSSDSAPFLFRCMVNGEAILRRSSFVAWCQGS